MRIKKIQHIQVIQLQQMIHEVLIKRIIYISCFYVHSFAIFIGKKRNSVIGKCIFANYLSKMNHSHLARVLKGMIPVHIL